ncbi:lipopolysaccharide transport periplasmic protein LptA [Shewanella corallii]|uniref:Lipopolysaccharide export system protein LptA n=1 Tax=Shewanella corallii TaxID=560080 RepID=A0ABT0N7K9_9GAMM|nr:lipopolysaccharide transport periplasmic protein LptA [Shewanella corallii]MCL2914441.1 lipopolysaccharide transport periplasmic protein LptA [Shewanella corallii]
MNQTNRLIAALLCTLSLGAVAATDDLTKEVHIAARSQEADIKNKRVVYNGPVVVTQGSIKILADELSASQGDGETILIATGKPATYTQTLDNDRPATASANEIRYNISKRVLTLVGAAEIEQDGSKVTAPRIVYDIQLQQMKAEGNQSPDDRVHTVIKPENFQNDVKEEQQKSDEQQQDKEQPES